MDFGKGHADEEGESPSISSTKTLGVDLELRVWATAGQPIVAYTIKRI